MPVFVNVVTQYAGGKMKQVFQRILVLKIVTVGNGPCRSKESKRYVVDSPRMYSTP